jgi:hypothetical protein
METTKRRRIDHNRSPLSNITNGIYCFKFLLIVNIIQAKSFSFFLADYAVSHPHIQSQLRHNPGVDKLTPLGPGRHVFKRARSSQFQDENALHIGDADTDLSDPVCRGKFAKLKLKFQKNCFNFVYVLNKSQYIKWNIIANQIVSVCKVQYNFEMLQLF